MKLFSHPYHKPWKSLRDSHIPSALRLIISIQFSNQKRSLPQLPIPLTFRLILQLEKTEGKKISLVTMAALYFCIIGQGGDYRCGRFTLTQSSWTELWRCVSIGAISTHEFLGYQVTNKPPQVLFRLLSIPAGAREWVSRHRSKSCDRGGLRFQLGAISGSLEK